MEQELQQMLTETKAAIKENDQVKERLEVLYSLLSGLLMCCSSKSEVIGHDETRSEDIQSIER